MKKIEVTAVPDDYVPQPMSRVDELLLSFGLPDWVVTPTFYELLEQAQDDERRLVLLEDRRRVAATNDPSGCTCTLRCMDADPEALRDALEMLEADRHAILGVVELHDEDKEDRPQIGWEILYGPR